MSGRSLSSTGGGRGKAGDEGKGAIDFVRDEHASLVLNSTRSSASFTEPKGDAVSLNTRKDLLVSLVDRARQSAPMDNMLKKKSADDDKKLAAGKVSTTYEDRVLMKKKIKSAGNVLSATENLDSEIYRPRTQQTIAAYEILLTIIQERLGNVSSDILTGAADAVLHVLKDESMSVSDQKAEIQSLLNTMSDEKFTELLTLSRKFTDFSTQGPAAAAAGAAGTGAEDKTEGENAGISVVFEDDDEEDGINDREDADINDDVVDDEGRRARGLDGDDDDNADGDGDDDAREFEARISKNAVYDSNAMDLGGGGGSGYSNIDEEGNFIKDSLNKLEGNDTEMGGTATSRGGARKIRKLNSSQKAGTEQQQQQQQQQHQQQDQQDQQDDDMGMADESHQLHHVRVKNIDAFWLQRYLSKHFPDPVTCQEITQRVHKLLNADSIREVENGLVQLLDFDKFDAVTFLVKNRHVIYYCTLLEQAQSEDAKAAIEGEMIDKGHSSILDDYRNKHSTRQQQQQQQHQHQPQQQQQQLGSGVATSRSIGSNKYVASNVDAQTADRRLNIEPMKPRRILDLEQLSFSQGSHLMSNKKVELPPKTVRQQFRSYEEIIIPPGPRPEVDQSTLKPVKDLPEWAHAAFDGVTHLNRIQTAVCDAALGSASNLLLCAPTGAGKTNVALLSIMREIGLNRNPDDGTVLADNFKCVYIAPMKSLVQEMVRTFTKKLTNAYGLSVKELSGDNSLNKDQLMDANIIVTTPEKWDIVTRKGSEREYIRLVRLIIIDEIHLLHDERGAVLECIVTRTLQQIEQSQDMVRIVGLSATLPNYVDVAAFLRVDPKVGLFFFDKEYRPVPLQQVYIGITEKKALKRHQTMNEVTVERVKERAGKSQVLIFVHSRKDTAKTGKMIRDVAVQDDFAYLLVPDGSTTKALLKEKAENAVKHRELKELLPFGIGIHHAGMTKDDREVVEKLFYDGHLKVLVSTATLAWGVNLPCRTVIIKGTQVYNPEKGKWTELSPLDVVQMMGRAGRPQFDKEGEGIIITTNSELQFYLSLLNTQLPVESQFISKLADNMNAEVALGTINSCEEASEWLSYTFLYVRMLMNPALYGIPPSMLQDDPYLEERRADLVHSAAVSLEKTGLVRYDRRTGALASTELGKVASYYYMSHQSMQVYNENMRSLMGDIDLFRLFSLSSEFKYMTIREEEKPELTKLLQNVPIPVKEGIEFPTAKVNVLLQCYISQLPLEGFALLGDMVYITQSAGRIWRALFEIALRRGWAAVAQRCLELGKMVEKRMWGCQSPLRQFSLIPMEVIRRVEKKDYPWENYYHFQSNDLGEMVRLPKWGKPLYKYIHSIPTFELTASIQPVTSDYLKCKLAIRADFKFDKKIHQGAETVWIFVEDMDSELLLHYEMFLLKERYAEEEHHLDFFIPVTNPPPPQYFIRAISDRWLGSDKLLSISLRTLVLPPKYSPATQVVDLVPVPLDAMGSESVHRFYAQRRGIKALNAIQSQVYPVIHESDENVLVCAPPGSGKTVCLELAILRMLEHGAGRCVYVAPLQTLVDERLADWSLLFGAGSGFGKVVDVLTGETAHDLNVLKKADIILSNAENWDQLSRRWRQRKNIQSLALFLVDELHLLGTSMSGSVLEVVISRMRQISAHTQKNIRIVAVSAPLGDCRDLSEWIGVSPTRGLFNFHPSSRPMPLEIVIQGSDIAHAPSRLLALAKPLYTQITRNSRDGIDRVIVFTPSRQQAGTTAVDLVTYASLEHKPLRFKPDANAIVNKYLFSAQMAELSNYRSNSVLSADDTLCSCIDLGVAYLHEAQSEQVRELVITLFRAGFIQVLCASRQMAWSLGQARAVTVVLLDVQYYDGREHRYIDYPVTDLICMGGLATEQESSPSSSSSSSERVANKFIIMCHAPKKAYLKKVLAEPIALESQLHLYLHDHLNSEIVTKTIENKQEAVDYLTWTLYYRRLFKNPNYYNLKGLTHQHISDHLSELIETIVADLQKSNCVQVDDDVDLKPMNLGMIASYYYIRYTTVELFNTALSSGTRMRGLLEIICAAAEIRESVPMRKKEEGLLHSLATKLPVALRSIDKLDSDQSAKANILLQCHLLRTELPEDMHADQRLVVSQCVRLLQSAVDVISSNGWLTPALAAMELTQMIVQAMWVKNSPLKQVPHFSDALIAKAEEGGVKSVFDLIDMDDGDRMALLKSGLGESQIADVALFCNRYPGVEMTFELSAADGHVIAGEAFTVKVVLSRDGEPEDNACVIAPFYPGRKEESFWVMMGKPGENTLTAIKRVVLGASSTINLDVVAPEELGTHTFALFLICDSYIGCDQELAVQVVCTKKQE